MAIPTRRVGRCRVIYGKSRSQQSCGRIMRLRRFDMRQVTDFLVCSAMLFCGFVPLQAQSCPGLHAGIMAPQVLQHSGNSATSVVSLALLLLNDSDSPMDKEVSSWRISIDGVDVPNRQTVGGALIPPAPLQPSEHFKWGIGLPVATYFPHAGDYRVSWRGKHFQSPTITVKIPDSDVGSP